ncbi:hypothetical protein NFI96_006483 [Prochilodus magdalenae]|nr:hypothetical protein NFI96_006483 [Prochilodus magdalenae]
MTRCSVYTSVAMEVLKHLDSERYVCGAGCRGMVCEKGIQILLTIVGAFASFGLMTVAIGTDYWLYSRALICNSTANVTQDDPHNKDKKDPGALTHSGLWRICCLEGQPLYFLY